MQRRDVILLAAASALLGPTVTSAEERSSRAVFWRDGDPGQRLHIRGRVTDLEGRPVSGATVVIWQADGTGVYTNQYQGSVVTDDRGEWFLITALPGQYAGNKHIHVAFDHTHHIATETQILFKGDADYAPPEDTIALEEAVINDQTVLLGRFEVKMVPG